MKNETVLLLTYYYNYEDRNLPFLRYIKQNYLGACQAFDVHFYEPLKKLFSRVIVYDYLKRRTEIGAKGINEEIIDLVRKERPKYVIWTSFYYDIEGATLNKIREEGFIVIGWFFDDEWRFDGYSKYWIPYLDYCVTNAIEAVPKYKELNAACILAVPVMGSVPVQRDWANVRELYDVSFVGSRFYADREQWINELKKNKIDVHAFGDGWGRYLTFEEMLDVFGESKINLNLAKCNDTNRRLQIKARVFEVCLAGGFLLTEYAPGIENFFEIDKEIVCFRNMQEMVDKVIYYLGHDEERRAIARAGFKRAEREYTTYKIMSRVFEHIKKDIAANPKRKRPKLFQKMSRDARRIASDYHFFWGLSALELNNRAWKESFALSIKWNPYGSLVWLLCVKKAVGSRIYEMLKGIWFFMKGKKITR